MHEIPPLVGVQSSENSCSEMRILRSSTDLVQACCNGKTHLNQEPLWQTNEMKKVFIIGIICVALGLLSLVVTIPHAQQQQFQSDTIALGVSRTEPRHFPVGVGGTLIIGGFVLMISGCREHQP
ncbi:MAG: hypothetical protein DMG64_12365 [Acidobacteria bacterium]|nr:MAG: hypothetical protein DMG63_12590 [Acidobacteriota bacterium]PYY02200.1 MAG: hypothetical protein DMG64_12365 [Acidobacteriota bacterium]